MIANVGNVSASNHAPIFFPNLRKGGVSLSFFRSRKSRVRSYNRHKPTVFFATASPPLQFYTPHLHASGIFSGMSWTLPIKRILYIFVFLMGGYIVLKSLSIRIDFMSRAGMILTPKGSHNITYSFFRISSAMSFAVFSRSSYSQQSSYKKSLPSLNFKITRDFIINPTFLLLLAYLPSYTVSGSPDVTAHGNAYTR